MTDSITSLAEGISQWSVWIWVKKTCEVRAHPIHNNNNNQKTHTQKKTVLQQSQELSGTDHLIHSTEVDREPEKVEWVEVSVAALEGLN